MLTLLFVFLAPAAWADVLVTKRGERIETDGPWEIKGRQVVFTSAAGTLSAVRLSEIDLEASDLATHPPPPPPPPPPAPPKERPEPVLVLTNKDIGKAKEMDEVSDFARAFGGALMEMQRALAHGFAEMSDDPDAAKAEIDANLDAQQAEIEEGMKEFGEALGEMLEAASAVADRYPELKGIDPNDPQQVQEHASSIRAAAAEFRAAAQRAQTDAAREMLSSAAQQMESMLAGG